MVSSISFFEFNARREVELESEKLFCRILFVLNFSISHASVYARTVQISPCCGECMWQMPYCKTHWMKYKLTLGARQQQDEAFLTTAQYKNVATDMSTTQIFEKYVLWLIACNGSRTRITLCWELWRRFLGCFRPFWSQLACDKTLKLAVALPI